MQIRFILAVSMIFAVGSGAASARDQIQVVGSSTVFPFASIVADNYAKRTSFQRPLVNATGTIAGVKAFCTGSGENYPDIVTTSRRIKADEFARCTANGVTDIIEVTFGFDGIVFGNAATAPAFDLTQREIYKALASETTQYGRLNSNRFSNWNEVTPSLPNQAINVIGPPSTSGTREVLNEFGLRRGGRFAGLSIDDAKAVKIRTDGAYIETGEDDGVIVPMLAADQSLLGVFGFAYLHQNANLIKGAKVNGVLPTVESISDGTYPLSRPLYFYMKRANITFVPGLEEYLEEFMLDDATGENGYAVSKGLVPLTGDERADAVESAANLAVMTGDESLR